MRDPDAFLASAAELPDERAHRQDHDRVQRREDGQVAQRDGGDLEHLNPDGHRLRETERAVGKYDMLEKHDKLIKLREDQKKELVVRKDIFVDSLAILSPLFAVSPTPNR